MTPEIEQTNMSRTAAGASLVTGLEEIQKPERFVGPVKELFAALAKAQAEFLPIKKTSTNPFYNAKYADLAEVIDATRPALTKHGLAVFQFDETKGKNIHLTTVMGHESGAYLQTVMVVPGNSFVDKDLRDGTTKTVEKFDVQTIGKASTYARRYSYSAICGVAAENDDDGNTVANKEVRRAPALPAKPTPKVDNKPAQGKSEPRPNEKPAPAKPAPVQTEMPTMEIKPEALQLVSKPLPDNIHGLEVTDADLPENMQPEKPAAETVKDPFPAKVEGAPTAEEMNEIKNKCRAYKLDPKKLRLVVLQITGADAVASVTKAQWDEVLFKLEAADRTSAGILGTYQV